MMVLAATNRPSELDEAILRRLPQAFEIGYPGRAERVQILKVILKDEKVEEDLDFDHISSLCGERYTGSDLLELCKQAAYFPVRDLLSDEKNGKRSDVSIHFPIFYFFILVFWYMHIWLSYHVCAYIFKSYLITNNLRKLKR